MTKQHLEALAAEISKIYGITTRQTAAEVVATVAKRFNPRFDADRFYKACDC